MLRNPAYAGRAVFGKTMVVHESPGLNRVARLQGRSTPRASKTVDRPRDNWTEIAVPAIVSEDTFTRVSQRLADNKRFASRNSTIPSLLQGIAACAGCGYGYYRTSTRTTNKKIYYYRCLGSDDSRYEGGRVCGNKPVRADYLDTVAWNHITALLADPQLIHAEIDKPAITRMIEAFGEQLITIDELRSRMPDLRARETNLRNQIEALDAQLADRQAYLTLASDLERFLTRLHTNAETSGVEERQRVLRLLVKDILIGPDKITIRHRIPSGNAPPTTPNTPTAPTRRVTISHITQCFGGVIGPLRPIRPSNIRPSTARPCVSVRKAGRRPDSAHPAVDYEASCRRSACGSGLTAFHAAATVTASSEAPTSCTRTPHTPAAAASAEIAEVASSRPAGGRGRPSVSASNRPRNRLREAPTSTGKPSSSNESSPRRRDQSCSAFFANPKPGSSTIALSATPAARAAPTRALNSARTSPTTSL
jgi:hypothetical protein